jgi:16S rRNA (adenine1518-N6/adenine1519-N6)-dimethyltransferase
MTGADAAGRSQRELLRAYGIRPVKRRGQNFLVDGNLARAIAQDCLAPGAPVLELGAGGGALTVHLLDGGARVTAVEVDRGLCALLRAEFGARNGFCLVEGDLSDLDWSATLAAAGPRPLVAGNLPYVLTSTVLFAVAERHAEVAGGLFMVQKEVADRLAAGPGGRDYGVLSVVLGAVFSVRSVRTVPPNVFWPRPEVMSAIVELVPAATWEPAVFARFVATVKALFAYRRKTLATCLRKIHAIAPETLADIFSEADVEPGDRPEQLTPAEFRRLALALPAEFGR